MQAYFSYESGLLVSVDILNTQATNEDTRDSRDDC
jgi:hypothetical protein